MAHEHHDSLPLSLVKSPLLPVAHASASLPPSRQHEKPHQIVLSNEDLHNHPQFHRHTETTNSELFYDLFFVANLTVFTSVKEVNDQHTLAQYIGFFCILWFTWYQVGLYDVRFSADSVFDRFAKLAQFGVMVGFAIVGTRFDVGDEPATEEDNLAGPPYMSFQALTLILMLSRLVLVLQYLQSLWFTHKYKKTRLPILLISATYFIAAMIYLGLFWSFQPSIEGTSYSYIAWYVIAISETIMVTSVSSIWRVISFKGTHLIQRMSLLTLIILGEGIMGLTRQCQNIVKSQIFAFEPSTIAGIACALIILYCLYMLYFDWMHESHFGTIREQLWAFIHFPLHLTLVLAVEGIAQTIAWTATVVKTNQLVASIDTLVDANSNLTFQDLMHFANDTAQTYLVASLAASKSLSQTLEIENTFPVIEKAVAAIGATNSSQDDATNALEAVFLWCAAQTLGVAGFEMPDSTAQEESDLDTASFAELVNIFSKQIFDIGNVYTLTFIYFFVSLGVALTLCAVLGTLSRRVKSRAAWIRLAAITSIGVGLALLSLMSIAVYASVNPDTENTPGYNFFASAWILPAVTLALALAVVINTVRPTSFKRFWSFRRRSSGKEHESEALDAEGYNSHHAPAGVRVSYV